MGYYYSDIRTVKTRIRARLYEIGREVRNLEIELHDLAIKREPLEMRRAIELYQDSVRDLAASSDA